MGLFSRKQQPQEDREYRGGCSVHEVQGPARKTSKEAHQDTYEHGQRMHGSKTFYGGYIERHR